MCVGKDGGTDDSSITIVEMLLSMKFSSNRSVLPALAEKKGKYIHCRPCFKWSKSWRASFILVFSKKLDVFNCTKLT